jgi:hypothetical protein
MMDYFKYMLHRSSKLTVTKPVQREDATLFTEVHRTVTNIHNAAHMTCLGLYFLVVFMRVA